MRALLVRVGADCTEAGGRWNAPVDSTTGDFAYVPIPEPEPLREGLETPFVRWVPAVERSAPGYRPRCATGRRTDPDFANLTYGDRRERARQIREKLGSGDLLVFYGLRDVHDRRLVYGLIGLLTVEAIVAARELPAGQWSKNAHTRRSEIGETDVVVRGSEGRPAVSSAASRCAIPRRRVPRARTSWRRGAASAEGRLRAAERAPARALRARSVPRLARPAGGRPGRPRH